GLRASSGGHEWSFAGGCRSGHRRRRAVAASSQAMCRWTKASALGGDGCGGVTVGAEASGGRSTALSAAGFRQPGSTDPGLAGDRDEADGYEQNQLRDELEKKMIGARSLRRPDLAAVVDVNLRPRRIWDGLDVVNMIDDLDCPTRHSPSVGFVGNVAAFIFSVVSGFAGVVDGNGC
ncbi:hypothetical protein ACLOJK_006937, partial [Asimina triloba]